MKMIIKTIFLVFLFAAYSPLYLTKPLPSGSSRDINIAIGPTGHAMLHNKENIAQGVKNEGGRPSGENSNNGGSGSAVIPVYAAGANSHKNHHHGAGASIHYGMGLPTLIAATLASVVVCGI